MQRTIRSANLAALLVGSAVALSALTTSPAAHAQGASLEAATDEQKQAAQTAFMDGMKAQKAGKKEDALQKFKDSYNAVASPNSHLMVARTLVELGRLTEAYEEYEKTIPEAEAAAALDKKYESAAQSAKTEQADVRSKIAMLKLNVTGAQSGDRVTVRGREIPQSDWSKPIAVMPGSVRVELQQASGKETVKEVDAAAGAEVAVELSPAAASGATAAGSAEGSVTMDSSSGGPSMRTWAYVAGGVGVAGVATFAIFGAMNNSKHSKLEDECTNGVCPADLESDRDAGKKYQTIANIGLVVGVVGLGAGTALYLMSGKSEKTAVHRPQKTGPRVTDVSVGYRSVVVSGAF